MLLSFNENTREVEEQEKSRFVRTVLDEMGVPTGDIWGPDGELTTENKIKLRAILLAYNIQVIATADGELQIYHYSNDGEERIVGDWKKPQYILRKDHSARDPRKKLYLEMKLNFWFIESKQ